MLRLLDSIQLFLLRLDTRSYFEDTLSTRVNLAYSLPLNLTVHICSSWASKGEGFPRRYVGYHSRIHHVWFLVGSRLTMEISTCHLCMGLKQATRPTGQLSLT